MPVDHPAPSAAAAHPASRHREPGTGSHAGDANDPLGLRRAGRYHCGAVPILRAFRALRYDPARIPDAAAVLCPPYDVISPELGQTLRARDPHNAIRLELPQPIDAADPDSRYKNAARDLAAWRTDGTLRKDRVPTITIHEQRAPMTARSITAARARDTAAAARPRRPRSGRRR